MPIGEAAELTASGGTLIPEPGTVIMVLSMGALGLLLLAVRRRRR